MSGVANLSVTVLPVAGMAAAEVMSTTHGDNASDIRHNGRCCRPNLGGSGVRTWTDHQTAVRNYALPRGVTGSEPEARQVPLQLREARNEAMGLLGSQMADEGATRDEGSTTSGCDKDAVLIRPERVVVYPSLRRSVERKYGQRVLRRAPDGRAVPESVRLGLRCQMGHSRQLACVGADRSCPPSQRQRSRIFSVAKHGPLVRAHLGKGATC